MAQDRRSGYWYAVIVLVVAGALTALTIGGLFWAVALVMILLSPLRSRPVTFRAGVALLGGFLLGFVVVAPAGCTQTDDSAGGSQTQSTVVCSSVVGVEYSGPDPFEPPLAPALLVGAVTGVVAAGATWVVARRAASSGA